MIVIEVLSVDIDILSHPTTLSQYKEEKKLEIFGNKISETEEKKAEAKRDKFIKKYGDDRLSNYNYQFTSNEVLKDLNCLNLTLSDKKENLDFSNKIIVGNIRMGFGHYRISMAIASCIKALGYTPVWMDLNSFKNTTTSKMIASQNDLYSMGSRWASSSSLFNKLYWEPLNYEGFRKLKQNVSDLKMIELTSALYRNIPKDTPYIATHVWPAQAAVKAEMQTVVNAIPDNWQMALHLAEGSIHTVQTPNSFFGYKLLRGMDKHKTLKAMPKDSIYEVGHYIDHELVSNIEKDNDLRIKRLKNGKIRYLLTVGGAGSQIELFEAIINHLLPAVNEKKVSLLINVGDHLNVLKELQKRIPQLTTMAENHFDDYENVKAFTNNIANNELNGIHLFYNQESDVLVTKPSELSFYPIPKLFIHRVGGHEKWGAIHSAEIGDGTYECETTAEVKQMLDLFENEPETVIYMCNKINKNKQLGIYDGGYKVVELALKKANKSI